MNEILVTVSGEIDPLAAEKAQRGERPLTDYLAMAAGFPADLLDYRVAIEQTGRLGRLLERLGGPNLMLAWAAFRQRRRYRVFFSDGEQVGLPLAFLLKFARRRPRHCMIAHRLSVRKKLLLLDGLRLHRQIDRFLAYSSWQVEFIRSRWHLPEQQVRFTPFMVDAHFFSPAQARGSLPNGLPLNSGPFITAVGLEYRDYPTLIEAVRGLPVQAVLAAASPWSKQPDTTAGRTLPENIFVRRFSQFELRELYAASRFMVMPLYPVDFQAGVTAILEAMAMGKAVVCTRTPGQVDVIRDGINGLYVPPGDPAALREAMEWLLARPDEAERMGQNGRQLIEREMSLECYVPRLKEMMLS